MTNNVNISILSNGFLSHSKSLLIVTENDRYLVNCGEGTQKIFIETGKKMAALKNVFITRKSQQNMCGLIGVALGINNNGINLCLHGVKESVDLIRASKKFTDENTFKLTYHENAIFEDKNFLVESITYRSSDISDKEDCVAYLFSTRQLRPKIDVKKCAAVGVPQKVLKSKRMAEFLNQSHVVLDDGRIIESKDVLIEPRPAEKFLVVECPSVHHVEALVAALTRHRLMDGHGHLALVFHLTDKVVYETDSYRHLIDSMNASADLSHPPKHVMIDSGLNFPLSFSSFQLQTVLHRFFDGGVFPCLRLYEEYQEGRAASPNGIVGKSVIEGQPFMEFKVNALNVVDVGGAGDCRHGSEMWARLKDLNEQDVIDEVHNGGGHFTPELIQEKVQQLKDEVANKREHLKNENYPKYPRVTFIGTSSSTPSKYRNISSILMETKEDQFVLLDCGEGTLDRLMMLYGLSRGREVIRNLRAVCISHHHLDHHSGLYPLLRYREMMGDCPPCIILAALNVHRFTQEMDAIFETHHCLYQCDWFRIDQLQIDNNTFATGDYPRTVLDNYEKELSLKLNPVRVYHTSTSYGFVISGEGEGTPWKVVYSGDRWPKFGGLVETGMDCDLLIHEATMDDGLEEMAARKLHSTVSQAIAEGAAMRSRFTLLTHFSSRHPLVPPVGPQHQNVGQAFDFMTVDFGSCWLLRVLDRYLEYLFPRHWLALAADRLKRAKVAENPLGAAVRPSKKAKIDQ